MLMTSKFRTRLVFLVFMLFTSLNYGQNENLTSDELYTLGRNAAFEEDDYPKAIDLLKRAIAKSPDYLEIQVFLGRI